MKPDQLSTALVLLCICWPSSTLAQTAATLEPANHSRTNILIIVSDDQGYRDLGCFGSSEILTPNLDRLAAGGVRLTNFYVSWPACTPSRGSLLTGRYPQRHGVYDMIRNEAPDYGYKYKPAEYEVTFERICGMDTREILLPSLLRQAGYHSGIFGKWDLGSLRRFLPLARGFDHFYGFVNTGIDYFTHERYGVPSMVRDNDATQGDRGVYCTDLFLREAKAFLADYHAQPFFLYLPFNAPHGASNLDPAIRSAAQGTDLYKAMYPELQAQAGFQQGQRYGRPASVLNRAARRLEYAAAVTHMDAAIGEVLDLLDAYQVADNTLVIFFSDNGGGGGSDNGMLRGRKGQMFEGGIRVPAIIRFPGHIPAGETRDHFVSSLDLLPTLLGICQVSKPEDLILDGFDILPVLQDDQAVSPRTQMFWQRQDDKAARVGNWKWVDSARGSGLFDLASDLEESHDLSQSHPDKLAELTDVFSAWRQAMDECEPRGPFRDF
jgi:arylsulfatase A